MVAFVVIALQILESGNHHDPALHDERVPQRSGEERIVQVSLKQEDAKQKHGPSGLAEYKAVVAPFFEQHCVRCHGPEKVKGKITVHSLNGDLSLGQELDKWESILDMLEFGEMPPIDEPQPKQAEVQAVIKWIDSGMRDYIKKASQEQAVPKTRRLTNVEYQNTLNALFGFELDIIKDLPKDPEVHYGFNNTAELMRIGPEQLDEYLAAARKVLKAAIVDPEKPEPYKVRSEWPATEGRMLPLNQIGVWGNRGGLAGGIAMRTIPKEGEYRIRFQAAAILPDGMNNTPLRIEMGGAPRVTAGVFYLTNSTDEPQVYEIRGRIENHPPAPVHAGKKKKGLVDETKIRLNIFYDDGSLNDNWNYQDRSELMPRVAVDWMEFEVPVVDVWPPKHHTDILFESPLRETDEPAYVRQVVERFLSRAFRRPATTAEVDKFAKVFRIIRPAVESFEYAMRETLAMAMITPQFLYHTESDPATDEHYAMASKLSYFLWACMPDQELLDLAAEGRLMDDAVIRQQVERMLADEKSQDFIEDFTLQWMSIRKSLTVPINIDLFPRFVRWVKRGEKAGTEAKSESSVRHLMMQETVGFVGYMIRANLGALNVVDSDFAYINERLAVHYGIEGIKGMQLRPVPIKPEHNRGGLLTHGSVLVGNGTGTAPHPIYRAVWLREVILGDHVAPPPSDVPALEETAGDKTDGALSIAALLAAHRQVESCNDCHFRLDPWGIPFEEYDAVGAYRPKVPRDKTKVGGFNSKSHKDLAGYQAYLNSVYKVPVDAKARVPHGPEINGMRELKDYLLKARKDDIAENVIRRLLSYGLGRELTYRDRFAVEALFDEAEDNDFKMRDIIVSICLSDVFREETHRKAKAKKD